MRAGDYVEFSSAQLAKIAGKGLRAPSFLSTNEVRALCASVLTQARNKKQGVRLAKLPKAWKLEVI